MSKRKRKSKGQYIWLPKVEPEAPPTKQFFLQPGDPDIDSVREQLYAGGLCTDCKPPKGYVDLKSNMPEIDGKVCLMIRGQHWVFVSAKDNGKRIILTVERDPVDVSEVMNE